MVQQDGCYRPLPFYIEGSADVETHMPQAGLASHGPQRSRVSNVGGLGGSEEPSLIRRSWCPKVWISCY